MDYLVAKTKGKRGGLSIKFFQIRQHLRIFPISPVQENMTMNTSCRMTSGSWLISCHSKFIVWIS